MRYHPLLLVVFAFCPVLASQDVTREVGEDPGRLLADTETGRALDQLVDRYGAVGFSGSVLVSKGGKVLLARGVGSADLEGKKSNTANTLFELASVTKQFTAAAICRLQEQGKLELDDSVADYLPDVPKSCRPITIRHLLSHTSGIPGTNSRGSGDDLAKVVPLFFKGGPRHEPGSHWEYWNQGYALLSAIIERCSGMSYTSYCKKELFERAGLTRACFTGDEAPKGASVAIGRGKKGKPRSALEHPYGSYGYQYRGMGGAVCDVWDLWRWDRALAGDKLLSAKSKRELFAPVKKDYALGWYVRRKKGRIVHSHGGGVRGFVCAVRRYPQQAAAVFVLSNDTRSPFYGLANALENALFGEKYVLPPAILSQEVQAGFAGVYEHEKGTRLVIEADGRLTRARIEWSQVEGAPKTRALIGIEGESFRFYDYRESERIKIRRNSEGAIVDLTLFSIKFTRRSK